MNGRHAFVVVGVLLLTLAGCGRTADVVADPTPSPSSSPALAIAHPRGHQDVVLRLEVGGGFVTVEWAFSQPADLVVTGDGTVYVPTGPHEASTRLVQPIGIGHVGEPRVQALLREADALGLLRRPPSYALPNGIGVSDGPSTMVRIDAAGGAWRHDAYALGLPSGSETGARARLERYVATLRAVAAGTPTRPYRPTAVRVLAQPVSPGSFGGGKAQRVPWPPDAGLRLAEAHDCAVLTAPAAIAALTAAGPLSRFVDRGVAYQVSAAVVLPGDDSC